MAQVSMKTPLGASAADVWQVMSDFNGLGKFVAAVASSTVEGSGVGSERTLTLQDGAQIVERLERFDNESMNLEYSILSGPLPVENYLSKMEVIDRGAGACEACWSSSFEPKGVSAEEAQEVIAGIYQMGFDGLKKLFE